MRMVRGTSLISLALSGTLATAPLTGALAKEDRRPEARTPVQHIIVVIAENRAYDHVFGTYVPQPSQRAFNLLSRGIVNGDGSPGPNFALGRQFTVPPSRRSTSAPPPRRRTPSCPRRTPWARTRRRATRRHRPSPRWAPLPPSPTSSPAT
jgi:phospholipase C